MLGRLVGTVCLATVVVFGVAATSLAGGPAKEVKEITFTIPAGQCITLPDNIRIEGSGTQYRSYDAKGIIHTTVRGTATAFDEDDGNRVVGSYRFNYANQNDGLFEYKGPFPVEITMTDHFNLIGNRGVNNIHAHFVWKLTATAQGVVSESYDKGFFNGNDPFVEGCDPI